MRRAIALAIATAASVLLIHAVSIAIAPTLVVEHSSADGSPSGGSRMVDETFELALPPTDAAVSVATPTTQGFPDVTVATTTTWAPDTTTSTRAVATTTIAAAITTTRAVPVAASTTTAPPATTTTAVITAAAAPGSYSAGAESEFLSRITGLRASVGLAGLAGNGELNNYARWWAKQMADSAIFSHSNIASLLDPWSTVGENLGYGPTVAVIFDKLVASPLHYDNIVDPRFTSVGVGAYVDSTGRIWTAHVFGG